MKNKNLILSIFTVIFAVGCAESAYTPTNGLPVNNTGIYNPNTGYPNNSGFQNNYQNLAFPNTMMNQMYPMYQQQNMLSWSFRAQIPGFYYGPMYRNCVQRRSYYTTCSRRVVRRTCPYTYTTNSTTTNNNTSANNTTNTTDNTTVANTNTTPVNPNTNTSNTDTNNTPSTDRTLVVAVSIENADAKALFDRLAKTDKVIEKDRFLNAGIKARVGKNYQCTVDGKASRAKNYVCDLDIRAVDGIVMDQQGIGQDGAPVETASMMYKGNIVNIGIPGEAPEVGYLTIAGSSAKDLYENLPVQAVEGKVAEAEGIDAMIKTLGQVKCYVNKNATNGQPECLIKIESNTGKVLDI